MLIDNSKLFELLNMTSTKAYSADSGEILCHLISLHGLLMSHVGLKGMDGLFV